MSDSQISNGTAVPQQNSTAVPQQNSTAAPIPKVILYPGKDNSLKRFHPWVFSGAIRNILGHPVDGCLVNVYSAKDEFLGTGHYQNGSIAVRILSFKQVTIDDAFWFGALEKAYDMRKRLGISAMQDNSNAANVATAANAANAANCSADITNCYRLVHGEGDFLPGLIIDIYNKMAVIQAHSAGMYLARKTVAEQLKKLFEKEGDELDAIYDKSSSTATAQGKIDPSAEHDEYLYKKAQPSPYVLEHGNKFVVDWVEGQKTGFFLDQRENRALVGKYSKGRKVLNLFCYTGGFSVYAMKNGALSVDSVDSSQPAVDMCQKNLELNGFENAGGCICADAMEFLRNTESGKYDLMIVDPPAFAKHRSSKENALRAYKNLNANAITRVSHGGLIFTFSCSQVVSKEDFALAVFTAAAIAKRRVRILYRLEQPADHPVNIYHPEGDYLKGLVLYVE
jgi:23S rRNA (cytosine1962-C5)-methyltransferase